MGGAKSWDGSSTGLVRIPFLPTCPDLMVTGHAAAKRATTMHRQVSASIGRLKVDVHTALRRKMARILE